MAPKPSAVPWATSNSTSFSQILNYRKVFCPSTSKLTCPVQGDNVARMIRGTENINSNTPIVAVTSYALDAVDHNLFDAVIEKPVSPSRLTSEIENLCYWKPPPQPRRSSIRMQREPSTPQRTG